MSCLFSSDDVHSYMGRIIKKSVVAYVKNEGAEFCYRAADQHFSFRYTK